MRTSIPIIERVAHFIESLSPKKVIVAVSGGLDSVVLLDIVSKISAKQVIEVIHVHHGLSAHADDWQAHVESLASKYGLACRALSVHVDASNGGVENAARSARYEAIAEGLSPEDVVLTGHHQDDQAETVLLRLFRGAGVEGLSAMKSVRALGIGQLGRPLLDVPRSELQAYAQAMHLSWVDDDSNQDTRFDRNYLRSEILPRLEKRWPSVTRQLSQTAQLSQEASGTISYAAEKLLQTLNLRPEKLGESLELLSFKGLIEAEQRMVLRYWLTRLGISMPSLSQFVHLDVLLHAAPDRSPEWTLDAWVLCRFKTRLYCLPKMEEALHTPAHLLSGGQIQHVDLNDFFLNAEPCQTGGLSAQYDYQIVNRHNLGGLKSRPVGRARAQTLKKLMLEFDVPPWLRDKVPVLLHENCIAAVGDYWVDQTFWVDQGNPAWHLLWQHKAQGEGQQPA